MTPMMFILQSNMDAVLDTNLLKTKKSWQETPPALMVNGPTLTTALVKSFPYAYGCLVDD